MNGNPLTRFRRQTYGVLIAVTVAMVIGRILAIERVYEPSIYRTDPTGDLSAIVLPLAAENPLAEATLFPVAADAWARIDKNAPTRNWPRNRPAWSPTFSSNDKSRWAMIRALIDESTFVIGRRLTIAYGKPPDPARHVDVGIVFEDGWQSIDKVLHPETHEYFSSKPPLLPVMAAGEYWLLKKLFGWRLDRDTGKVVVTVLITFNAIPLALYLIVLARIIERYGSTDWGRLFTFAAACFATYLTTFANTLNNHTVAAYTALFAIAPLLLGWTTMSGVIVSGLFAGLTAAFELPAAAFVLCLAPVWLVRCVRASLGFVAVAAIPVVVQLGLNYAETGDWKPVYEKIDSAWYRYEGSHWNQAKGERRGIDYAGDQESRAAYAFHLLLGHHGWFSLTPIWLLCLLGWTRLIGRRTDDPPVWRLINVQGAAVSLIVIVFFAVIVGTVNYGGWTSGARWFFWLTPFWLLALLPAADWLAHARIGRGMGLLLLALSVVSVSFPAWNPWRHPWIYRAMEAWGWKGY